MRKTLLFFALMAIFYTASCGRASESPEKNTDSAPQSGGLRTSAVPAALDGQTVAGEFKTPLLDKSSNRMTNITLASNKINGVSIAPGAEFSFNAAVGPRTMKRGYRKATIFVEGEKVKETGGGICQIATTLYNAAQNAGLEITERHPHGQKVHYVENDKDATVFYGRLDLKFKNTLSEHLTIDCKIDGSNVIIKLIRQSGGASAL